MTRNEAIEVVEKYIESFEGGASIYEALKMATDALKNEDAVIDKVLEIIEETYGPTRGSEENVPMSYAIAWSMRGELIKDKVLALKEGE